ncbi:acyl-CoA dehydrogenase family protein [Solimicrobium silvestre]|uniref:Acyl-CoA dehydrogenase n=1 Tax=Solimicrobium silvestre TaxID=2099400 RepID=A0A2S9H292_9BURK|nr:acyl-CoA dehydrogenase family protein [Solimicrobium silvestre]PRC94080.1 Acyl-CoA dehydrogenase [Solimicrobium silvestre]
MDFELTQEQLAFQQSARDFAAGELAPHAAEWDANCTFPIDALRHAGELGFCGIYSPEEEGGLGLSRLDAAIIFEELAAVDPSTTAYLTIHNMATWMLCEWGTEELRKRWGKRLTSGREFASYCLTEAGSGSDAASLKTRAEPVANGYVLNGSKAFISGAGVSALLVVMARTGGSGATGISAFAVPADTPGISFGRKEEKMGWNSQPTRSVFFENVRIPADHLLGDLGDGFRIAMRGLDGGRINIATCSVGAAQGALNAAQIYVKERKQFGRALADFQSVQFKLADMLTDLVAARHMVRLAATKLDAKAPHATAYCAMAKRLATDIGFQICNDALQIHGGNGYIREYPLERLVRDTRAHQILEGTNEIMRSIIARKFLETIMIGDIR